MSKIQFQYDIQNLTPANAQPVEANFTKVEQHINQEVVERDGTVAMRAQLKLVGDPVSNLDAAPKQYVDQVIPVGLIMMWGAAVPPANGKWLLCDGTPLQTAAYPELFTVIGYTWGGSGGSFNAPALNGRFPFGADATHAIGTTGGSAAPHLPAHTHTIDHTHPGSNTGFDAGDHHHNVPAHNHGAAGLIIAGSGSHNHSVPLSGSNGFIVDGIGASPGAQIQIGGPAYGFTPFTTTQPDHGHGISGNTANSADIMSGGVAQNHSHPTPALSVSGGSGWAGTTNETANMPPFISIPYIIRCR